MNCLLCKYREQIIGYEHDHGAAQVGHHHHVVGIGTDGHDASDHGVHHGHHHHGHHHHHGEEHKAPHGGTLVELGDHKYHAEIVWDEKAKSITVFLLDGEAKSPVSISSTELVLNIETGGKQSQHKLAAKPLDDDGEDGQSSRFVTTDTALFESFHDNDSTAGQINLTIQDKPFAIVVTHKHHDHDHDHGDHKEDDHDKDEKTEHSTDKKGKSK